MSGIGNAIIHCVGTETSRIFKASDGGATWRRLLDGFAASMPAFHDAGLNDSRHMADIETAESNPNVVWACAKGYCLYRSSGIVSKRPIRRDRGRVWRPDAADRC